MNQWIILNGLKRLSKRERRIIPVSSSISKKARKVFDEGVQRIMEMPPLTEVTKIVAGMM